MPSHSLNTKQRYTRNAFWIIFGCFLFALTATTINYWYFKYQTKEKIFQNAQNTAKATTQHIDAKFDTIMTLTDNLAQQIESGQIKYKNLKEKLHQVLVNNPELYGIGIAFLPYKFNSKQRLYSIYYAKPTGNKIQLLPVKYDYTNAKDKKLFTSWFTLPMASGPMWTEPYISASAKTLVTEYSKPLYKVNPVSKKKEKIALLYTMLPLDKIRQRVQSYELGHTGYAYIISKKGVFISHPIRDFVGFQTIFNYAKQKKNPQIAILAKKALSGKSFYAIRTDPLTDQQSFIFYRPIKKAGWTLGIDVPTKGSQQVGNKTTQLALAIFILAALTAFIAYLLIFRIYLGSRRGLWGASIGISLTCLAICIAILMVKPHIISTNEVKVFNYTDTTKYLRNYETILGKLGYKYYKVPTGILLTEIDFLTARDVHLAGFIWQTYTKGVNDNLIPGVIFPQAQKNITLRKIYQVTHGKQTIIGWRFYATIRTKQNSELFPFDPNNLFIEIIHRDFAHNVILMPDFSSYYFLDPKSKPGIGYEFFSNRFALNSSQFAYWPKNYKTDFGIGGTVHQKIPHLTFNVNLSRRLISPFVNYYILAIIISIMVFALIIIPKGKQQGSVTRKLAYLAALIFIASLAHIRLRSDEAIDGVSYLETSYVIIYIMALITAVELMLYNIYTNIKILQRNDNLFYKLAYWPILTGLLLITTIFYFGI